MLKENENRQIKIKWSDIFHKTNTLTNNKNLLYKKKLLLIAL